MLQPLLSSYFATLVVVVSTCVWAGCGDTASPSKNLTSPAPLSHRVFAVSYPLQFLTQEIVGEKIEVLLPFEDAGDPRKSRPTRETIELMQESDLVIANGVGARYAKWLVVVSLPESKIVNAASYGLALSEFIAIKGESIVHAHGPEGEHSHPVMAARTWLDPYLAKKQAGYIAEQLKKIYPEHADQFAKNLGELEIQLDELVASMERLKELTNQEAPIVLTAGSQFEFYVRAAGLSAKTLRGFSKESDPGEIFKSVETQLKELDEVADSEDNAKPVLILLDQSNPLPASLSGLFFMREMKSVQIDLLDRQPKSGDYISTMKLNMERLEEAIKR